MTPASRKMPVLFVFPFLRSADGLSVEFVARGCIHHGPSNMQHADFTFGDHEQRPEHAGTALSKQELPDLLIHGIVFGSEAASLRVDGQCGERCFESAQPAERLNRCMLGRTPVLGTQIAFGISGEDDAIGHTSRGSSSSWRRSAMASPSG